MRDWRFAEISDLVKRFDKLPDDAFLKALEENGVTSSDLKTFAREREKRERAVKMARRR